MSLNEMFKKYFLSTLIFCIILTSCSAISREEVVRSQFVREFGLDISKHEVEFIRVRDNYEGFPYEGMALYKISFDNLDDLSLDEWDPLPLSDEAKRFLVAISSEVKLPEVGEGYWKLIDRSPETLDFLTNASLCVFDTEKMICYYILLDS